jgi:hypothetical protein
LPKSKNISKKFVPVYDGVWLLPLGPVHVLVNQPEQFAVAFEQQEELGRDSPIFKNYS